VPASSSSKRKEYDEELSAILDETEVNFHSLSRYLVERSNLPGPRANLELLEAFARSVASHSPENAKSLWSVSGRLSLSEDEFVAMCGVRGFGELGSRNPTYRDQAFSQLLKFSADRRWRVREAVAMALQGMISLDDVSTLKELDSWVADERWLQMRAVTAGVAEPRLMKSPAVVERALRLHEMVFDRVLASENRSSEDFVALKKGLAYSLSVVVAASSTDGFRFMEKLISSGDADVLWICRENLKKNRLARFPETKRLLKAVSHNP